MPRVKFTQLQNKESWQEEVKQADLDRLRRLGKDGDLLLRDLDLDRLLLERDLLRKDGDLLSHKTDSEAPPVQSPVAKRRIQCESSVSASQVLKWAGETTDACVLSIAGSKDHR